MPYLFYFTLKGSDMTPTMFYTNPYKPNEAQHVATSGCDPVTIRIKAGSATSVLPDFYVPVKKETISNQMDEIIKNYIGHNDIIAAVDCAYMLVSQEKYNYLNNKKFRTANLFSKFNTFYKLAYDTAIFWNDYATRNRDTAHGEYLINAWRETIFLRKEKTLLETLRITQEDMDAYISAMQIIIAHRKSFIMKLNECFEYQH